MYPFRIPLKLHISVLGECSKSTMATGNRTGWKYLPDVVKFFCNPLSNITRMRGLHSYHLSGVDFGLGRKLERIIQQFCQIQRQHFRSVHICCHCLVAQSCPTLCDPKGCTPPGSSVPGDSPGNNTGVGCHALLQGIFPNEGLNSGLLHCRQVLYRLNH